MHCRKVRFGDEFKSQRGGILEDDDWLNPEQRREQEYKQLVNSISIVFFLFEACCVKCQFFSK